MHLKPMCGFCPWDGCIDVPLELIHLKGFCSMQERRPKHQLLCIPDCEAWLSGIRFPQNCVPPGFVL